MSQRRGAVWPPPFPFLRGQVLSTIRWVALDGWQLSQSQAPIAGHVISECYCHGNRWVQRRLAAARATILKIHDSFGILMDSLFFFFEIRGNSICNLAIPVRFIEAIFAEKLIRVFITSKLIGNLHNNLSVCTVQSVCSTNLNWLNVHLRTPTPSSGGLQFSFSRLHRRINVYNPTFRFK